ncbi:acetyltransferase [Rhodoblastus acidophilus]|uniref:bifunctional acetate--CoA ligase family protein/GNAT family N-acetyltransferase n=1 Tax=Rhodoblastus acidophilus TaxID=1074 RepID=UPI00222573D4|nr:bifunctional acetate--CoA ligase family protein/GNAT family N-acetyltransferase [Rhodoblastus acidophilus]MCW2285200.1 acetyltransferase [Rhodoblastus acidophilus]MCW2334156.1 acetyltransferase [Rhodoblastus acidophilus]
MSTRQLDRALQPKSLALVGASDRANSRGRAVMGNIVASGFTGPLYLVNPRHTEIEGRVCYPNLAALPEIPDLVMVITPKEFVAGFVNEAADLGAPAVMVMTKDPTPGSDSLFEQVRAIARARDIRILGPNCRMMAPRVKLNASLSALPPAAGDLAVISQSYAVLYAISAWGQRNQVGFSGMISLGGMADVDFDDLLDYYALDPMTRAILLYIEHLEDAKSFMSAARAASRVKPVIVVRSGRHEAARRSGTHAGNLATDDDVYDAAFRRAGVLRVPDIDALFDAAEALGRVKPFNGERLAIVTNGRGVGYLAIDQLLDLGGKLAEVSPATCEALKPLLPESWPGGSPVELSGDTQPEQFGQALSMVLQDRANDAVLVIQAPNVLIDSKKMALAAVEAVKKHRKSSISPKPVFVVWYGADEETNRIFEDARIPHYERGAVSGFMHMVKWRKAREALMAAPPSLPVDFAPNTSKARAVVAQAISRGHEWLAPVEISALLESYDIPIAPARLARSPEEAAEVARLVLGRFGGCVVKITSRDIVHKSDLGGVALDQRSIEQVVDTTRKMLERVAAEAPHARVDGVTIHPMVRRPNARELVMGVTDDPTFGPVIVFGRGGKAVEVINDKALALPPLDLSLARALIEQTQVVRALRDYRDVPAADIDAVALLLVKISQLSADVPEIRELELNPVLADANGVVVVDARVAVAPFTGRASSTANPRFAVAPYPKALERHTTLKNGTSVQLRPVRPEDEEMYKVFFTHVSSEDIRLRFFGPVKEFSHAFIARLIQIDYARSFVIVAVEEETGLMLGVVRLMLDADHEKGEYAILLRSDMKGQGLGWKLMKYMIEYARADGIQEIEGQVLSENGPMLSMNQALGFKIMDDPNEHGVKKVVLDLTEPPTEAALRPDK